MPSEKEHARFATPESWPRAWMGSVMFSATCKRTVFLWMLYGHAAYITCGGMLGAVLAGTAVMFSSVWGGESGRWL